MKHNIAMQYEPKKDKPKGDLINMYKGMSLEFRK